MAVTDTLTTRLSLTKPGVDGPADILELSANFDILDAALLAATSQSPAALGLAPVRVVSTGAGLSGNTGATNEGSRRALVHYAETDLDDADAVALMVDTVMTSNPTAGIIKKTGIHSKAYTLPDNGGDTSAGLFVQTGGGGTLTTYKVSALRPAGYTSYATSPQGALEAGCGDQSQAVLALAGTFDAQTLARDGVHYASNAIYARIDNLVSKGIIVNGSNGAFDARQAFVVGVKGVNGPDTGQYVEVLLNGQTRVTQLTVKGQNTGSQSGQGTAAIDSAGSLYGTVVAASAEASVNAGGMLLIGAGAHTWAALKGMVVDDANNGAGDLVVSTRRLTADATLTEHTRFARDGALMVAGALDHNGTALGFYGHALVARAAAYTPTNVTPDRSFDADTVAVAELADVVGSLIADLQTYGLLA